MSARGARLVLCARDAYELSLAQHDLVARGARDVLAIQCDISDRQAVNLMIEETTARYGRIDVLVNNAGIMRVGPLETMTYEDFREVMAADYWGALHTSLAVIPQMRERGEGRIVNITSIGGRIAFPHLAPYSAAKFALVGLSEALHAELAEHGVRVTTVVPGFMRTGSPLHVDFNGNAELEYRWFAAGGAFALTSMDARRAARKIVRATERGDGFITIGVQAKVIRLVHDLAPRFAGFALSLVARLLPAADGDRYLVPGHYVTDRTPAIVEKRIEKAALASNQ
jgi:NAD(P)-dependent dehydrogenase (short-subunit alcohol dehydrogenase family)